MTWRNPVLVCVLVIACSLGGLYAADDPPYPGKVFRGIQSDRVQLPEDSRYESTWGLVITGIPAMSSAEAAGLRVGDVIASIDGSVWTDKQIHLSRSFGKAGDRARPGDVASCLVLRKDPADPTGQPSLEKIPVTLTRYPRTQPDDPRPPTNDELRPDLVALRPAYQEACWKLIDRAGWREPTEDLLRRLDRCDQFPDPDRLPIVRYVLRDPFKLEAVARESVDTLRGNGHSSTEQAALAAARLGRPGQLWHHVVC